MLNSVFCRFSGAFSCDMMTCEKNQWLSCLALFPLLILFLFSTCLHWEHESGSLTGGENDSSFVFNLNFIDVLYLHVSVRLRSGDMGLKTSEFDFKFLSFFLFLIHLNATSVSFEHYFYLEFWLPGWAPHLNHLSQSDALLLRLLQTSGFQRLTRGLNHHRKLNQESVRLNWGSLSPWSQCCDWQVCCPIPCLHVLSGQENLVRGFRGQCGFILYRYFMFFFFVCFSCGGDGSCDGWVRSCNSGDGGYVLRKCDVVMI